jgi:polysaccharide pyruvyl transferase WcaK-like protein
MTVDIRGTNSFNLGAQLMLLASVRELAPHFRLSAPPQMSDYGVRSRLGLQQTLVLNQLPRASMWAGRAVPAPAQRALGLVDHAHVTGVVDASGFAYSDSFSRRRIRREAVFAGGWRRRGVPVVLLPQAFGPFKNAEKREWTERLLGAASLVFARDRVSLEYLKSLRPKVEVVLSPDFTVGLEALPVPRPVAERFVAIVPNHKLVSAGKTTLGSYVEVLGEYAAAAEAAGLVAIIVVHDEYDASIAERVAALAKVPRRIVTSTDPLELKGLLGQAEYAVASRFHAVVSALSGGVPTIALGWSHKYEELLRDFDVPEWSVRVNTDPRLAFQQLTRRDHAVDVATLMAAKERVIAANREMWDHTVAVLGGEAPSRSNAPWRSR